MNKKVNIHSPLQTLCVKDTLVTSSLVLLLMIFAIGVVFIKHTNRILHIKLQELKVEQENLNNEGSQLLLEKATWTSNIRVEKVAREQLSMIIPNKIEMIKP